MKWVSIRAPWYKATFSGFIDEIVCPNKSCATRFGNFQRCLRIIQQYLAANDCFLAQPFVLAHGPTESGFALRVQQDDREEQNDRQVAFGMLPLGEHVAHYTS